MRAHASRRRACSVTSASRAARRKACFASRAESAVVLPAGAIGAGRDARRRHHATPDSTVTSHSPRLPNAIQDHGRPRVGALLPSATTAGDAAAGALVPAAADGVIAGAGAPDADSTVN